MATLLEKIEASAAQRLALPEGRLPAQELDRYKAFLKVETHRLKILHRAGAGGREICRGRAQMMDALLRHMWESIKAALSPQSQKEFPPLALVATGGYGRAELNPWSDIDFTFLHDGQVVAGNKPLPHLARIMDGILYPLWDLGLKVGHTVRSVEDSVQMAQTDMQSKTALIEARRVTGSEPLFEKLTKAVLNKCVAGEEDRYIAERLEDQAARHAKFGNSPFMQEPNIKNGCGGLRDYQNLLWMVFFKYRARSPEELKARGLLSDAERRQLEAAYDYLLRVRNELHYHAERAVDVLTRNVQPAIAHALGYTDRSPSRRLEKFMREVYTHARNIYLINRTLEQRLALQPAPRRLEFIRGFVDRRLGRVPVETAHDGFKFIGGYIHAGSPRVFREQPRRLMRVFMHAQQRGLNLHPDLAQLIRSELSLANRSFLYDPHVRETFLGIFNQRGNVARVVRSMHETGLLGKYIPEFGRLTCLVQHEFYHQYTTDEHTLVCLEKLDRVWEAKETPYSNYSALFQGLERPFLLYLAMLLHDTGKAEGEGKHAEAGTRLAARVAKRLELDGAATHTLMLVIEHHLLMAITSQRHDLEDPTVIRTFASRVPTPETLALLTIHTFADSLATSDKLWNDFKDSLLWSLHRKAMALLTGGTDFIRVERVQKELLEEEVRRSLTGGLSEEECAAHFGSLPPRYFEIHSTSEILRDLALAHRFMHLQLSGSGSDPLSPVVAWHNEPDRGYTMMKIATWDRTGLFSKIAGALSIAGLNILSARIFTRADAIALDTFFVTDARTGAMANREEKEEFEKLIERALKEGKELEFHPRRQRNTSGYSTWSEDRIPTQISFDNDMAEGRTVIEVETEDRVGLLYALARCFAELELDISAAKIVTEKGAAIDSFYVTEADGSKILDSGRQSFIERKILDGIRHLN